MSAVRVIEVDREAPFDPYPRGAGSRFLPALAVLLAVGLLLNGGSHSQLGMAWQTDVVGGFFWLGTDGAYTIERAVTDDLLLVARDADTGEPRWRVALTGPLARAYLRGSEVVVSRFPPPIDAAAATLLIDSHTGRVVRAYPAAAMPLVYVSDDVAVTIDAVTIDREPAEPEPDPVELGAEADGRDQAHVVVAYDLHTGAVRWTRRLEAGTTWALPGTPVGAEGMVGLPPQQGWMATVDASGVASTTDLQTGLRLATRAVGLLGPESYVIALQSTVISRTRKEIVVFEPRSFDTVWRVATPAVNAVPFECAGRLCLQTGHAVWAVDRSGAVVWRAEVSAMRASIGPAPVLVAGFGQRLALFDAATGERQPVEAGWRVVDVAPVGTTVLVARPHADGGADLGRFDTAAIGIITLGDLPTYSPATQCLAVADRIACEDSAVLRVWHQ